MEIGSYTYQYSMIKQFTIYFVWTLLFTAPCMTYLNVGSDIIFIEINPFLKLYEKHDDKSLTNAYHKCIGSLFKKENKFLLLYIIFISNKKWAYFVDCTQVYFFDSLFTNGTINHSRKNISYKTSLYRLLHCYKLSRKKIK